MRELMPVEVGAGNTGDPDRPITVWTRDDDGILIRAELTLELAWELVIALGERIARHPAPALPSHPHRARTLAAPERPPVGSYWSAPPTRPAPARPAPRSPGRRGGWRWA